MALDIISFAAVIISVLSATIAGVATLFSYRQQKTTKKILSMTAYLESLKQLGTDKAREARALIYQNFPDYSSDEPTLFRQQNSLREEKIKLRIAYSPKEIQDSSQLQEQEFFIKDTTELEGKTLSYVAVGFDRVGFMLFELDLSEKLREKYLDWMGETICTLWNRLAPHIAIRRAKRKNYAPHFQRLAVEAYKHYYKQMDASSKEKPRLVIIENAVQYLNQS